MPAMTIARTRDPLPDERGLEGARALLFNCFKGVTEADDKRWRRFFKMAIRKEPGEMFNLETVFPRYTPFHKRHMKIEQDVFNSQDRFKNFEMFRDWLKIGSGFVEWVPGAKGGIVPLPKSISYASIEEQEFREFHDNVIDFLRGEHAAVYLWKHLGKEGAADMMNAILSEFQNELGEI